MSENKQPFTEHVTRQKAAASAAWTHWLAWVVAGVMAVTAIVFFLMWSVIQTHDQRVIADMQSKLDAAANDLANALAANQTNQDQIAALQTEVDRLQKDKDTASQMAQGLEDEMHNDLASKDVTISKLQGKLTVNILDRVMFDSGEAVLKPAGAAVMKKIAALLAKHPELKIQVIGHTDNVPVRPHSHFASNWELSTARALAAVHYLVEQAGVDPHRLGAVGYGEYRPIADNATAEGRAQNRRIAITILPDELAVADAVPPVKPDLSTNIPPEPFQKNTPSSPPPQ